MKEFRAAGIVRHHRWLAWGWKHGSLRWAPKWVRKAIVFTWNHVSCYTLGHYKPLLQYKPGELPVCAQCCRGVIFFGQNDVIRLWEID